jgi:hypothetical protein
MVRTVKHFSLHRIGGTELRVVADVEVGVLPVIQAEEAVIRGYAQQEVWPHRWVTLFILEDLQPLVRQLRPFEIRDSKFEIPMGGAAALNHRPVVNVYDLADPSTELRAGPAGCHVFVNRQAVAKEGYWDDPLAIRGLLAHEHAHPLVENETIRSSRQLRFSISDFRFAIWMVENRKTKIENLLALLADKLCLYAPREIFANEMTIRSGFGEALLHLDRRTIANASRGVAGRDSLRQQLQGEVVSNNLTPQGAALLLLIGDLKGYLDLALEVAPFYRTGRESEARELEAVLEAEVFPHLEPEVPRAYIALRDQYIALLADLTPAELMAWSEGVLRILAEALAEKGLEITYCLSQVTNRRET